MMRGNPQAGATPPAPQAPQAPALAPLPPPTNERELRALTVKRSELTAQLESVTDRRQELEQQLEDASGPTRPGLEQRIRILDQRAAKLEETILQTDDAITTAIAGVIGAGQEVPGRGQGIGTTSPPRGQLDGERVASFMVAEALAFILLGVYLYRRGFRRAKEQFSRGAPADPQRIEQLQNSIDAIAVEVERISEGQRFVSKMLNEGSAQPLSVGMREAEAALAKRKSP